MCDHQDTLLNLLHVHAADRPMARVPVKAEEIGNRGISSRERLQHILSQHTPQDGANRRELVSSGRSQVPVQIEMGVSM